MAKRYTYEDVYIFEDSIPPDEVRACMEILSLGYRHSVESCLDDPYTIRFRGGRDILLSHDALLEDPMELESVVGSIEKATCISHENPKDSFDLLDFFCRGIGAYEDELERSAAGEDDDLYRYFEDDDYSYAEEPEQTVQKAVIKLKKKLTPGQKASAIRLIDSAFTSSEGHIPNTSKKENKLVYIGSTTAIGQAAETIADDADLISMLKSFKIYEEPFDVLAYLESGPDDDDWEVLS